MFKLCQSEAYEASSWTADNLQHGATTSVIHIR